MIAAIRTMLALVGAVGVAVSAEVRVVGSDLLGSEFSKAVYDAARRSEITVRLALDGSRPGLGRLRSGWADIGLLTLPADEEQTARELFQVERIAYHCVFVLVAEGCPLQRITLAQLAGIFGAKSGAAIRTWGEMGVEGAWTEKPLVALAPESGVGVALEYFRHVVMAGGVLRPAVGRYRTEEELREGMKREPHALVIAATIPKESGWRALAVGPTAVRAVLPMAKSLETGDYVLRLPLQLVTRKERAEESGKLLAWFRSAEAGIELERAGLVAVRR